MKLKTLCSTAFLFLAVALNASSSLHAQITMVVKKDTTTCTGINTYEVGDYLNSTLTGSLTNNAAQTRWLHVEYVLIKKSTNPPVNAIFGSAVAAQLVTGATYTVPANTFRDVTPGDLLASYTFKKRIFWSSSENPNDPNAPKTMVANELVNFGPEADEGGDP